MPTEIYVPNIHVMGAGNVILVESQTRLEDGFPTPRVDKGLDFGEDF